MNLRHLRCFIAVAEELHFGRAARRLHIEQSPLSRTIRKLETTLGVTLLSRTPRGATLTWAGRVFLEDALGGVGGHPAAGGAHPCLGGADLPAAPPAASC